MEFTDTPGAKLQNYLCKDDLSFADVAGLRCDKKTAVTPSVSS